MTSDELGLLQKFVNGEILTDVDGGLRRAVKSLLSDLEKAEKFPGTQRVTDTGNLSKRDLFAFELAKMFIKEDYEKPLTNAVEWADALIKKLEESK